MSQYNVTTLPPKMLAQYVERARNGEGNCRANGHIYEFKNEGGYDVTIIGPLDVAMGHYKKAVKS